MKAIKLHHILAASIILAAGIAASPAQTAGSSPSAPASLGATLSSIIECGEGYTSHELYDAKLTLVEVVRGEEAWKRIKEASASNKPAEAGLEYVLVRVKFEYKARGTPGLCVHKLSPDQFSAYSAEGEGYKAASITVPKPEMSKGMKSGEMHEGWIAFAVPQQDKAPLMTYSAEPDGAVQHGGGKWFRLQ